MNLGLRPGLLLLLALTLLGLLLLALAWGSVEIPPAQVLRILMGGEGERPSWSAIIWKVRLPKALTALLAGAALGGAGLMMQTFFRNPLADPFVLGLSSAASLGVAAVILAGGTGGGRMLSGLGLRGDLLLAAAAALGAGGMLLLMLLAAGRFANPLALLVLGLMASYFVSAMVSLLLYFAAPERIQAYLNWTFGSFSGTTWDQLPILAGAVVAGLSLAWGLSKPLNALLLGEQYAQSLGVNLRLLRYALLLATGLLAGTVTAFCGPIGFIGIAAPHLCRGLFRSADHRVLMPGSMLLGGMLALGAALLAEAPGQSIVLPLNAVLALIGAPVVMLVILRQAAAPAF
jgi:iron complex transport system permease protein